MQRRYLIVAYDVTDLAGPEADQLAMEAAVQGEQSDGHPTVNAATEYVAVEAYDARVELRIRATDEALAIHVRKAVAL